MAKPKRSKARAVREKSKPAKRTKKKASTAKKRPAPPAKKRAPSKRGAETIEGHPGYRQLLERLRPGPAANGLVLITKPGALDDEMSDWLLGNVQGRRSIGRTAFGELLVFRDLRARARELGSGDAEREGDVALIDIHYKKMTVLGTSVDAFLEGLEDRAFQDAFLRRAMFEQAVARLGPLGPTQCYGFVPALALGGEDSADSLDRVDWRVHQALLLQS